MLCLQYVFGQSILVQAALAGSMGVVSHLGFFIRGEHHMNAPLLTIVYLGLSSILLLGHVQVPQQKSLQSATNALIVMIAYFASLCTSIAIYRTCFHRLRHFPGPFMARVSKLWHVRRVLDSQNHILMDEMFEKYGEFVRTGMSKWRLQAATLLMT